MGGVPRHIFCRLRSYKDYKKAQKRALDSLYGDQARKLALNEVTEVDNKETKQPRSAIIGYIVDSTDETFSDEQVVIVSEGVEEAIYSKFIKLVWNIMLERGPVGGDIFESYTRTILAEKR